jgi:hypothetical protein
MHGGDSVQKINFILMDSLFDVNYRQYSSHFYCLLESDIIPVRFSGVKSVNP